MSMWTFNLALKTSIHEYIKLLYTKSDVSLTQDCLLWPLRMTGGPSTYKAHRQSLSFQCYFWSNLL